MSKRQVLAETRIHWQPLEKVAQLRRQPGAVLIPLRHAPGEARIDVGQAQARPMPEAAPVITATCPASRPPLVAEDVIGVATSNPTRA